MSAREESAGTGPARLAALLQQFRKQALLSQEELAERSQVSVRTIRDLERGRVRAPRAQSVRLLATALVLTGEDLEAFLDAAIGEAPAEDRAPKQLPAAIPDLTGRDHLAAELHRLADQPDAMPVVVVTGPAGVGKSALAVAVAHRLRPGLPDGQLYVRLRDGDGRPLPPSEALARFLRVLGVVGAQVPAAESERAALFRSRLADRRVLILLDDAHSEEQVRSLLPGTRGCAVLVTSRARLTGLEGASSVDVDVLDPDHAVALLARIAGPSRVEREREAAAEIARRCGYLPIALRIAGARLAARPHWPLRRLADLLSDEQRRLDELAAADLEVRAGLELSYRALPEPSRRAFQAMGLLGAVDAGAWTVAALLDADPDATEEALEELVDARLLELAPPHDLGAARYTFHDLVRLYAREQAEAAVGPDERRAALTRALGAWLTLADEADARLPATSDVVTRGDAPRYALPEELVAELVHDPLAWFESERANFGVAVAHAAGLQQTGLAWELAAALVSWAGLRSHWDVWRRTHELALTECRRADDRRGEAAIVAGLGKLAGQERAPERALALLGGSLAAFRSLGDLRAEARVLPTLGFVLQMAGRVEEGLAVAEQGVALARELGAPDSEADALFSLAQAHLSLGRPEAASAAARAAVLRYRELGKPLGETQALWQLAMLRRQAGDLDEAVDMLRRCQAMVEAIGDRRGQARILLDLGTLSLERGAPAEALAPLRACVALCEEIGERHFLEQALAALTRAESA